MVDQEQAPTDAAANYDGWAVAYVTHAGPVSMGYMGRLAEGQGRDVAVVLTDAFEYMSIRQQTQGGVVCMAHGTPMEFTRKLSEITVRPVSLIRLDGLRGDDVALFAQAHKEANELREGLRQGPAVPTGPQRPSGLVTPGGQSLAGVRR